MDSHSKRTAAMKDLCERWRDTGLFKDVCGPNPFGIHDYPNRGTEDTSLNYVFEMERSACALFGIVTYGVHMSIYEEETSINGQKSIRVWVPTRASTKQTWPGYLDNSVAGGVPAGMPILESMIKECMEEASLEDGIVRKYIQPQEQTVAGWLQPEIEYVFDIRVPTGSDANAFVPKPLDGEVESFELLPFEEITTKMRAGYSRQTVHLRFYENITRLHGTFGYNEWAEVGKPKGT
ncbi:NUDIX hydrolase domain-like protein [Infundibulicybe gibba]|nr:NUDIX hydrolase domain-like protein [Infundibulicybe gibba]